MCLLCIQSILVNKSFSQEQGIVTRKPEKPNKTKAAATKAKKPVYS